jgi:hypothetical protein
LGPGQLGIRIRSTSKRSDIVGGDTDSYLAFGQTELKSSALVKATRRGDQIHFEGDVSHGWNDVYDFSEEQPGGAPAVMLHKHRGARPFDIAEGWSGKVRGTVGIRDGELTNPRFTWTDVDPQEDLD